MSRCSSKFRIISSKELPSGAPEGLKTQAHAEQPKPPELLFSIQMSLRLAAIIGGRQNRGCGCFLSFFSPISLWSAESFMHAGGPPHEIRATGCFDRPRAESAARVVWFYRVPLGRSEHIRQTNRVGLRALFPPGREEKAELCRVRPETCAF